MIVDDVGGVAHFHGCDFLFDLFEGAGFVEFDDLNRVDDPVVELRTRAVDFAHGAVADLLGEVVLLCRVLFGDTHF